MLEEYAGKYRDNLLNAIVPFGMRHTMTITVCGSASCDIIDVLTRSGVDTVFYDDPMDAVNGCPQSGGLMVLAESYPAVSGNCCRMSRSGWIFSICWWRDGLNSTDFAAQAAKRRKTGRQFNFHEERTSTAGNWRQ